MREREERQSIQHVVHVQRAPFPTTVTVEGVIQTLEPHPTILRPKFCISESHLRVTIPSIKGQFSEMGFLSFFQIMVDNFLSGKLWKWPGQPPKGQPSRNKHTEKT